MQLAALPIDVAATIGLDTRRHRPANQDTLWTGPYERVALLGKGGMGNVWRARHRITGQEVALKELRPELARDKGARRRFHTEATLLESLSHPGVVKVLERATEGTERPYLVMELLEGESLFKVLARGHLPLPTAVAIARQLAEILAFVHARGVVHRDLKPENLILVHAGGKMQVKLLDFGVAKLDAPELSEATAAGVILGTPEYMSPEQLSGSPIDQRSDIYAFGVILYELLTGQRPFVAKTFGEMVIKHLTHSPVPPSLLDESAVFVPEALEDLTLACLAKLPDDRPRTMHDVLARLRRALELHSPRPVRAPFLRVVASLALAAATIPYLPFTPATAAQGPTKSTLSAVPAPPRASDPLVSIAFSSTPPGAEVYLSGDTAPLGRTPFTWETPARPDGPRRFEFRLKGYRQAHHDLDITRHTDVSVVLAKRPPASKRLSAAMPPPDAKLAQRRLLDPFADD